jgi:hypothetical protein
MKSILEMFVGVCAYQASRLSEFSSEVTVTATIQREARKLLKDELERAKFKVHDGVYRFTKYKVKLDCKCSCTYFQKYAMCVHYAAVALLEKRSLKGMPIVKVLKVRGNRSKKVVEATVVDPELERRLHALDDSEDEEPQQKQQVEQPVKNKRGRKPGSKKAVQNLPENPEFMRKQYQGNLRSMTKALQKM